MQPIFRFCARAVFTIAFSVLIAACPGEIDRPERFPPRMGGDAATTGPRCSLGIQAQSGLDLVTPNAAARIAATGAYATGSCRGRGPLVNASDPSTGLFFDKLASTPACGESMPLGAPTLSAAEIECVRAYMLQSQTIRDAGAGTDATAPTTDVTRTDVGAPG
jgi:hypothetical protein